MKALNMDLGHLYTWILAWIESEPLLLLLGREDEVVRKKCWRVLVEEECVVQYIKEKERRGLIMFLLKKIIQKHDHDQS